MKDRELEGKVMRFVREIGIALESKVRTVVFDLKRGVVVISTDEATYAAPAAGLWSDYVDNVARIRPQHARLIKCPEGRSESGTTTGGPRSNRPRPGESSRFDYAAAANRLLRLQSRLEAVSTASEPHHFAACRWLRRHGVTADVTPHGCQHHPHPKEDPMPSASRSTTPVGIDMDVVEGRYAELDDHTVSFETFKQDLDVAPYFRGLPGDACTCPHLGLRHVGPDHLPVARPRGDLRRG